MAIEIKATVPHGQIRTALTRYKLTRNNDELRLIYFFDTPELALLKAGIIVRARRAIGDEHDSTIKFRPVRPEKLAGAWHKYRGFKIEFDASEKGLIKRVVARRKNSQPSSSGRPTGPGNYRDPNPALMSANFRSCR